jgi:AcrR family transcriptional regulator
VLEAAATVFAAKGTSASTEEIAREAGVGIGTVFRHFPTKQALLEAILADRLARLTEEAQALSASPDPGAALLGLFTRMVAQSAAKKTYVDALADSGLDAMSAMAQIGQQARQALGVLLARAQQAGAVRDGMGVTELIALVVGASRAAEHAGWDQGVQARVLQVIFDGLRPPPPSPQSQHGGVRAGEGTS